MEKIKILVAHPGKQHSLKLAEAISKNDKFDVTYATTVYDKNSSIMMKLVKLVSSKNNKERANARKSNCLNENKVKMFYPFLGLIRIFLRAWTASRPRRVPTGQMLAQKIRPKNQVRTATNPKAASPGSAPLAAEPKRA